MRHVSALYGEGITASAASVSGRENLPPQVPPRPQGERLGWGRAGSIRRLQKAALLVPIAAGLGAATQVHWQENIVGLVAMLPTALVSSFVWPLLVDIFQPSKRRGPILRAGTLDEEMSRIDFAPYHDLIRREGHDTFEFFINAHPSLPPSFAAIVPARPKDSKDIQYTFAISEGIFRRAGDSELLSLFAKELSNLRRMPVLRSGPISEEIGKLDFEPFQRVTKRAGFDPNIFDFANSSRYGFSATINTKYAPPSPEELARQPGDMPEIPEFTGYTFAISESLFRRLNDSEVLAIFAHELSHLRYKPLAPYFPAALTLMAGSLTLLAMAGTAPWALVPGGAVLWLLLWSWSSKADEFMADAGAAALTGDARTVAETLSKTSAMAGGDAIMPWWQRLFWRNPPTSKRLRDLTGRTGPARSNTGVK